MTPFFEMIFDLDPRGTSEFGSMLTPVSENSLIAAIFMPNAVTWFEHALACMRDTRLTEARKASVIMLLSGYVRNVAATESDIAAAMQASGLSPDEWMSAYPRMLTKLTDPQRFPALTAFIAAGVFDLADGPDDEFIFGLDRILDGIEHLVEANVEAN